MFSIFGEIGYMGGFDAIVSHLFHPISRNGDIDLLPYLGLGDVLLVDFRICPERRCINDL